MLMEKSVRARRTDATIRRGWSGWYVCSDWRAQEGNARRKEEVDRCRSQEEKGRKRRNERELIHKGTAAGRGATACKLVRGCASLCVALQVWERRRRGGIRMNER